MDITPVCCCAQAASVLDTLLRDGASPGRHKFQTFQYQNSRDNLVKNQEYAPISLCFPGFYQLPLSQGILTFLPYSSHSENHQYTVIQNGDEWVSGNSFTQKHNQPHFVQPTCKETFWDLPQN